MLQLLFSPLYNELTPPSRTTSGICGIFRLMNRPNASREARATMRLRCLPAAACCLVLNIFSHIPVVSGSTELDRTHKQDQAGVLQIQVLGLKTNTGFVCFGLYNEASHFAIHKGSFRKVILPVTDLTCEWRLENIPYGDYAVMLYHDVNGNNKFDRHWSGFSKEPYGISNNASALLGIPKYKRAKFNLQEPMKTITITLR
jgi:uncharacterized protein (DUF2141 family)